MSLPGDYLLPRVSVAFAKYGAAAAALWEAIRQESPELEFRVGFDFLQKRAWVFAQDESEELYEKLAAITGWPDIWPAVSDNPACWGQVLIWDAPAIRWEDDLQKTAEIAKDSATPWVEALGKPFVASGNPLVSMLTGGLVGAGLGYGGSVLAEHILPANWDHGRLRNNLMLAGALAGAVPGGAMAAINAGGGRSPWDDTFWPEPEPNYPAKLQSGAQQTGAALAKTSEERTGLYDEHFANTPWIPVDQLEEAVYNDPRVANRLSTLTKNLTTGLARGAELLGGNGRGWVSPVDVARVAMGAGAGYASGVLVAQTLGALTGMPQPWQEHLKNTGMYAGALQQIVPLVLGGWNQ